MKPHHKKELDALEKALWQQQQTEQEALEAQFTDAHLASNWTQVDQQLHTPLTTPTRVIPLRYFWRTVAGLVGVLLLSWGYHFYSLPQHGQPVETSLLPTELLQAEKATVVLLQQQIKHLQTQDTAQWIAPQTLAALEELDQSYQAMKQELLQEQNGKILIEAMLKNLQLRYNILQQSVQQLERLQNESFTL